jgi:hypothetical protein
MTSWIRAVIISVSMLAVGCTQYFAKDDMSEFRRDLWECRQEIAQVYAPPPPQTTVVVNPARFSGLTSGGQALGAGLGAGIAQRRMLRECMEARGYRTE